MKVIKKLFLAVLLLFTFVACSGTTINLTSKVAPIKVAQKKVLVAAYPKSQGDLKTSIDMIFTLKGWKVNFISFWEVDSIPSGRNETFLIVIDKMLSMESSFFAGNIYEGNIKVYDLRTGNKIVDYDASGESDYGISVGLSNTLGKLIEK